MAPAAGAFARLLMRTERPEPILVYFFTASELIPAENETSCCWRVKDADAFDDVCAALICRVKASRA